LPWNNISTERDESRSYAGLVLLIALECASTGSLTVMVCYNPLQDVWRSVALGWTDERVLGDTLLEEGKVASAIF